MGNDQDKIWERLLDVSVDGRMFRHVIYSLEGEETAIPIIGGTPYYGQKVVEFEGQRVPVELVEIQYSYPELLGWSGDIGRRGSDLTKKGVEKVIRDLEEKDPAVRALEFNGILIRQSLAYAQKQSSPWNPETEIKIPKGELAFELCRYRQRRLTAKSIIFHRGGMMLEY